VSETIPSTEEESTGQVAGSALVEIEGLKTYYGSESLFGGKPVRAVDGVDFTIQRGETLGLVGESGCGKSTLGRTLVQLESATDGRVLFDGEDITELSGENLKEWRKNVQIVFQDPEESMNDRMTVGEIVREPLDVHKVGSPDDRRERVRELLATVGLQEEHYFRYPHQFSGGQRQRIGIARALALEPDFIVLDEPVSALDVSVQAKILNLLDDLQEEFGLTYLLIAHDLSVVRHVCDRVAVMYLGHIMELGETEELFQSPSNPYTHALLSAIPEPDPTSTRERITLRGTPPSPRDPPAGCPFSTRCPAKIRPSEYSGLDDELWSRIEVLREVTRERSRASVTLTERAKRLLGRDTRHATGEDIRDELFADLPVPGDVRGTIDAALDHLDEHDPEAARDLLREEFNSVCDTDEPELLRVSSTGRTSYCHRHTSSHEEPDVVVERRHVD
jgi:peptide/nickel transport system ATP-binding protein